MIGIESDLPEGYQGYVFQRGQAANGFGHSNQKTDLALIGEFSQTTEWRKDQWVPTEDSYPKSIASYLECSAILNAEDWYKGKRLTAWENSIMSYFELKTSN